MIQATYKEEVIAESNDTILIEGNHYFPVGSVKEEYLVASETRSRCPWKGEACYYSIRVGSEFSNDAAWYYPEPLEKATEIKNMIAFWKDVIIKEV